MTVQVNKPLIYDEIGRLCKDIRIVEFEHPSDETIGYNLSERGDHAERIYFHINEHFMTITYQKSGKILEEEITPLHTVVGIYKTFMEAGA